MRYVLQKIDEGGEVKETTELTVIEFIGIKKILKSGENGE